MEDLQKTCLYESHTALGAKMSPFGGFIMPIEYSSITAEHMAVRQHVGMFDVSHMGEVFISGPDAERFVNHLFTNDVSGMKAGKILYGMMLYPDGGVVDDLLVYKMEQPDLFLLVVNAANIAKDVDWIRNQRQGYNVDIRNDSAQWGEIAVQGPEAERVLTEVLHLPVADLTFYTFSELTCEGQPLVCSRTGYTGEDGFELYASPELTRRLWDTLLNEGKVVPCGLGCRDTLRFEVGLPLYGHELSAEITPIEAGLGIFVKTDKTDFIGREAIVRQKAEGVSRKLVGIELQDKAIPRAGYEIEADGRCIGTVTTGYHTLSTDKSVCLALVEKDFAAIGTPVAVRIRKKVFAGTVCKKRFYEKNYKK
ncbi:MAG: glycine cleavage system aminomethyltransferase GcvT [Clostridium sp.]|nr:glycine cleavage system aminomethyltransferase GcvT [Clostridium sp.]